MSAFCYGIQRSSSPPFTSVRNPDMAGVTHATDERGTRKDIGAQRSYSICACIATPANYRRYWVCNGLLSCPNLHFYDTIDKTNAL
jgi:hypothetical protein